jgi:hypothetical protein
VAPHFNLDLSSRGLLIASREVEVVCDKRREVVEVVMWSFALCHISLRQRELMLELVPRLLKPPVRVFRHTAHGVTICPRGDPPPRRRRCRAHDGDTTPR